MWTFEGHKDRVSGVAITHDGRHALSASWDNTLRVWDLTTGQSIRTLQGHNDRVSALTITPNGDRAVSASDDQTLRVWDVQSGVEILTFTAERAMMNCAVTPDGRTVVAGDRSGGVHFLLLIESTS
jgi:WD40 repeat protein